MRLVDSQWNIQAVQREIVMSAAYRQSSVHPDPEFALQIDPGNRLLWRKSVRRLDAEQFRDTLLVAMDGLIDQVGGPSVEGTQGRRSLYLRRYRNQADEMLAALDLPPAVVGTAKRDQTTTAPQALMMLNNPRMMQAAKMFAARVSRDLVDQSLDQSDDPREFIRRAYRILIGTCPDDPIVEMLTPLVAEGTSGEIDACHVLLNSNQFLYLD